MNRDRSEEEAREDYEFWTWGLTPDGDEYQTRTPHSGNVESVTLNRVAVHEPSFTSGLGGVYRTLSEAAEKSPHVDLDNPSPGTIETVNISVELSEFAGAIRDRIENPRSDKQDPETVRGRTIDAFRWELSEGIVTADGKFKWICSCGAEGMDLHKSRDDARDALWEHRNRDSCDHGGPPEP